MAEPWGIHTLVFDLDDTLIAEKDYALSGFAAVDEWARLNLGQSGFGSAAADLFKRGRRGRIFDEAMAILGLPPSPELVSQLVAVYRNHQPQISLLPDAKASLDWAQPLFRLGLISDGWLSSQQLKVSALKLDQIIPTIILTDVWGRAGWKPSPQAFLKMMQGGVSKNAEGFVYVGDNPRKDFITPRRLGWKTVRIRRNGGEYSALESNSMEAAERELFNLSLLPELISPLP